MNEAPGIQSVESAGSQNPVKEKLSTLILGALGVVYGDIGTSVLYAFRECFNQDHGVAPTNDNIMGILSLIFWVLTLVVTVKYLFLVMRADNEGEGGIFALMSRVLSHNGEKRPFTMNKKLVVGLGICGTSLLVAEGMITPTISVLSALEGLQIAAPATKDWILPISVGILIAIFMFQRRGTAVIGAWFGPIMLLWFLSIAALGIRWIAQEPAVLAALNPVYAVKFFADNHLHGLIVLGAVVLCVTGCEALFADLGHFGRKPIALAWNWLVFPSVVLNYFGQGALVMHAAGAPVANPFFECAPSYLVYPVVALATAAAIIASQALITGLFSLVRQAIRFDYLPRLRIIHTSVTVHGQIYVPQISAILGVACVALALGFRTSSSMAAAYGIAVIGTMATSSLLMFAIEYEQWKWKLWQALLVTGLFLSLDIFFLVGNLSKILLGGWFTLVAAAGVIIILTTWKRGNQEIRRMEMDKAIPLDDFVANLNNENIYRVQGCAMFLTPYPNVTPRVMLHHLKHNKTLHKQVIVMSAVTENVPSVALSRIVEARKLEGGFSHVIIHFGFMQHLDVKEIRQQMALSGVNPSGEISYFIGHITLRNAHRIKMASWRKALFAFFFHNEPPATDFLGVPPNRVVELGEQVEI